MTTTGIVWKQPPPARSHTIAADAKWAQIASELRKNRGKWAHVDTRDSFNAAQLVVWLKQRYHLDARQRRNDKGSVDVFARAPRNGSKS